jgi:hypothetical protein
MLAANQVVLLLSLKRFQEENVRRIVRETILSLQTVPPELLDEFGTVDSLKKYITETDKFAKFVEQHSSQFVSDLKPGHQHKDIHCISFLAADDFQPIIGLPLHHFGALFESISPQLRLLFPRCPSILSPGDFSLYCSTRFKLFLCLFRLKVGCSFPTMSKLFGWCASSLQEWHEIVLKILDTRMREFHTGFINRMSQNWQEEEVAVWKIKHLLTKQDYGTFLSRIECINAEAVSNRKQPRIRPEADGSIGAWDGTFSVRPRITPAILINHGENPTADKIYSDYAKAHGYKLVLLTSHGIDGRPKFIMWVEIGSASAHDNALLVSAQSKVQHQLIPKAFTLGDHAFHGCYGVVVPYSIVQMIGANKVPRQSFNHSHSSDRMTSEHGVMFMKLWGVVRGNSVYRYYEREDMYEQAVRVCWALHNYRMLDAPKF